ncbi:thioesterase II family protein [Streptomyces sp. NPDC020883]|uniref:thioesterase II family protein n=1 Tax=Streptomyces sp. NPDC020883 TaxID=3365099 RepID=UPI003793FB90
MSEHPHGTAGAAWLRCFRTRPDSTARLVCFAHAGGAASAFRTWPRRLPDGIELHAVQYPGRQDRAGEPHIDDMEAMADAAAAALRPLLDRPMALLGHSMGAAIAYEVLRRLEDDPDTTCAHLFVSGHPAPDLRRPGSLHQGGDAGLIEDVRRLGAIPPEALDNPTLRELFLPTLRADYRLIERYVPTAGAPVRTPITVLMGEDDPEVTRPEALAWSDTTSGAFVLRSFPGGHFYLTTHETQVVDAVTETLTGAAGRSSTALHGGRGLTR